MKNDKYNKINCSVCDCFISKTNITHHIKSNKHIKNLNQIEEIKKREIIDKFSIDNLNMLFSMNQEQFDLLINKLIENDEEINKI